jgi:diketogulonate reductase-like aldo/keto reductase
VSISRRSVLAGGLGLLGACGSTLLPHARRQRMPTLPTVGMGTYTLGDDPARRSEELAAVRTGIELGLRFIDTAEMYGDGRSESLVGEAIRGRKAFVCTKVRPDRASYEGTLAACAESRRRLGVDQIDLYLLHLPPTRYSLEETMRAFDELVRRRWVKAIGVSNFETAAEVEAARGKTDRAIACDQVKYGLRTRRAERALASYCREQRVALVGYMPFDGFPEEGQPERVVLEDIARAQGASAHQVALAFLARDGIVQIPRASSVAHVRDNAAALRLRLTPAEVAQIDRAFPA